MLQVNNSHPGHQQIAPTAGADEGEAASNHPIPLHPLTLVPCFPLTLAF